MRNLLLGAAALCVLTLPAAAQAYYTRDAYASDPPPVVYSGNTAYASDGYDQGYRDGYDRAHDDAWSDDEEDVVVTADNWRAPLYDPYGETTADRHPLHGRYNFSSDGTSKVGGWTEAGPHTTASMAMGAAGYGGGGDYSTGP